MVPGLKAGMINAPVVAMEVFLIKVLLEFLFVLIGLGLKFFND